jgi:CBS domain-containing protein
MVPSSGVFATRLPAYLEEDMTVAVILKHKGAKVETVRPSATVQQVSDLLALKKIGAVVVTDAGSDVVGIVSERDIVQAIARHGARSLDHSNDAIMTRDVVTCRLTDSSHELMEVMTRGRCRHVPVVDGGKLVGIVSIGDIVKRRIEDADLERVAMRDYIAQAG